MTATDLRDTAAAWADVLDVIPTHRLQDAYRAAMRGRAFAGLITPNEIVTAWDTIRIDEIGKRRIEQTREYLKQLDGPRLAPAEIRQLVAKCRENAGGPLAATFNGLLDEMGAGASLDEAEALDLAPGGHE